MINVDLVEEVSLPWGISATRGNALSSVMEFGFKTARRTSGRPMPWSGQRPRIDL